MLLDRVNGLMRSYYIVCEAAADREGATGEERTRIASGAVVEYLEGLAEVIEEAGKDMDMVALMQAFMDLRVVAGANLNALMEMAAKAGFPVVIEDAEEGESRE